MNDTDFSAAAVAGLDLAPALGKAIPDATPLVTVIIAALALCVYTAKRMGTDKLTIQKWLVKIWDASS